MQNNNMKLSDNLVSKTKIYLVIILILLFVICYFKPVYIVPSVIVYLLILLYTYLANNKRISEISEQLQDLTLTVDSAAKSSLINSPFPLVILKDDGNVVWKSAKFTIEFADIEMNTYINELIIDIKEDIEDIDDKKNKTIEKEIIIADKNYKVVCKVVNTKYNSHGRSKLKGYMSIVYFIDQTESVKLKKEYNDSKSCIGIVMIDNYDETMQRIDPDEKPLVVADIEKRIYDWANETNGVVIKSERDTFVCIFEQKYLEEIKSTKFKILDTIKEVNLGAGIQLTLSIALSTDGETDKEKYKSAQSAMKVVLGRGGDQATILENSKYLFFGGRAEEVEKRTKVKARTISHNLSELIGDASKIMIMGHKNPDMDSIGSSLGIYRLAKTFGKEAFIVCDKKSMAIKNFFETLFKDEEYSEFIIDEEEAETNIDQGTLLIIVDTHKRNYVEAPELLDSTSKIVVIDHHRKSTDYIENTILSFQEVYASSASELVTELIQYSEAEVELKTIEAESLYAGIMVDTKNFTFKTGVRTFEAAAYLRKYGVDIIRVKKWFQSDLDGYNKIAEIVKSAELINESIAISTYDEVDKDSNVICAKAADELLTISNVTASFVLGKLGDKIGISGRSIGDINVQVILEKLGGGGHITLAGAQVEGSIEEVKENLKQKIEEYFNEMAN